MSKIDRRSLHARLIAPLLGLSVLAIQACSHGPATAPQIVAYGPHAVKAGVVFNRQPNGDAALWIKTSDDLLVGAVIVLNGTHLTTHIKGNHATAAVPAANYAKPGSYPLQITETFDGRQLQSNVVQLVVN